jgi:PLP dependent protein
MPGSAVAALHGARERVLERIDAACARSGRDPGRVLLVAVSKTVAAERLVAAVAAGLDVLAENRVQEAEAKAPLVAGATWHLVGPLQSNKAKRAVELFGMIQSVDSLRLAERLDRLSREVRGGSPLPVLLQVNVDDDPAKAGFPAERLGQELGALLALEALDVRGLMTIGRLVGTADQARATFIALRELAARLQGTHPALGTELSMGMSDDYEVAVEEGATIVRVGRALFGARPVA